ncbi:MAG: hypothetical protein NTW74_25665 [Acidobacteria bacterium]|nr:hypothetical protein [Acidobacteriota bacterium]
MWPTRLLLPLVLISVLTAQSKRPMNYADTDAWRSISGQKLSPAGNYLGYALFPQDADGEVVIRNLATNAEIREAAGLRPPPPAPDPEREGPPVQRTSLIAFSPDAKYVAFSTFPKKGVEKGKTGLVLVDLTSSKITRLEDVKSYQLPSEATSVIAYLKDDKDKTLVLRRLSDAAEIHQFGTAPRCHW